MNRAQIRARLQQLAELRTQAQQRVEQQLSASLGSGLALSAVGRQALTDARSQVDSIDLEAAELAEFDRRLASSEDDAAGNYPGPSGEARSDAAAAARLHGGAVVRREARVYERHDLRTSYLRDLASAQFGIGAIDPNEARQRLSKHAQEVRVDLPAIEARQAAQRGGYRSEVRADGEDAAEVRYQQERRDLSRTDGAGGEFVPPLWMVEQFVGLARPSRVMADRCNMMPLPPGTDSINIPRVATGMSTAAQTADNAAISETDATSDSVSAPVRTIAGQQDIAIQLLDQSPIAFDQVVFGDLAEDHAVRTDIQVINGSAANGQVRGILQIPSVDTTAYTDGTPTVAELYPKLADSANVIATTRHRPVTEMVMHPRRWYWMLAAVDSTSRPLVTMAAQGPTNALAAATPGNPAAEGGPVGVTPFGAVYLDPNIPTNLGAGSDEDVVILTRGEELYLWESSVRTRVLQEPGSATLTVRFQLFSYVAFMPHRRPQSTSIVSGTGLVSPSF